MEEDVYDLIKIAKQNGMTIEVAAPGYQSAGSSTVKILIAESDDFPAIKETIIRHFWKVQGRPKVGGGVHNFDFPGKDIAKRCIDYYNNLPA